MFSEISNAASGLACGAVGVGANLASGAVGIGCAAAVAVGDAVSAAASFGWDVLTSPPAIAGYKFLGYTTLLGMGVYAVYVVATVVLAALPYLAVCAIAYAFLSGDSSSSGGGIDPGLYRVKRVA